MVRIAIDTSSCIGHGVTSSRDVFIKNIDECTLAYRQQQRYAFLVAHRCRVVITAKAASSPNLYSVRLLSVDMHRCFAISLQLSPTVKLYVHMCCPPPTHVMWHIYLKIRPFSPSSPAGSPIMASRIHSCPHVYKHTACIVCNFQSKERSVGKPLLRLHICISGGIAATIRTHIPTTRILTECIYMCFKSNMFITCSSY